nr:MAG TPA: hypothetical protein [Caudoviricetes sp.]
MYMRYLIKKYQFLKKIEIKLSVLDNLEREID